MYVVKGQLSCIKETLSVVTRLEYFIIKNRGEKKMKIIIQPKQHHESKMTPDELQEHLKMCRNGASSTKNGKRYIRKPKHNKRLSYC